MFLEKITEEKQLHFSFEEIYELECIREQKAGPIRFKDRFLSLGIIERVGRTSGAKYILAQAFYKHVGKPGVHTRLTGLSRDQMKELVLNHLRKNQKGYAKDFQDALNVKRSDVSNLLTELGKTGKIQRVGNRRSGYWELSKTN